MYQKCPICSGSGTITTAMSTASTCPTCNGKRIISQLTGLPPTEPNNECLENSIDNIPTYDPNMQLRFSILTKMAEDIRKERLNQQSQAGVLIRKPIPTGLIPIYSHNKKQ